MRLYRHELECPAYRDLSPVARALLVEMRALYNPKSGDNRVFMGVRDMMARCGVTQRVASRARDELIDHGWMTVAERGSFHRKVKHATVYALENEPPSPDRGAKASKAFAHWRPPPTKKHGSEIGTCRYSPALPREQKKAVTVAQDATVKPEKRHFSVAPDATQIPVTKQGAFSCAAAESLFWTAATPGIDARAQLVMLSAALAASANRPITRRAA